MRLRGKRLDRYLEDYPIIFFDVEDNYPGGYYTDNDTEEVIPLFTTEQGMERLEKLKMEKDKQQNEENENVKKLLRKIHKKGNAKTK